MRPRKLLVAGLGNPLQGSDGFGPAVIERLRAQESLPEGVELAHAGTDVLSWLDSFGSCELVVLVDAVLGPEPREVIVVAEEAFGSWPPHSTTAHELSPLIAVQLFRVLRADSPTRFVLVGLKVQETGFADAVTPAEAQAGAAMVLDALAGTA